MGRWLSSHQGPYPAAAPVTSPPFIHRCRAAGGKPIVQIRQIAGETPGLPRWAGWRDGLECDRSQAALTADCGPVLPKGAFLQRGDRCTERAVLSTHVSASTTKVRSGPVAGSQERVCGAGDQFTHLEASKGGSVCLFNSRRSLGPRGRQAGRAQTSPRALGLPSHTPSTFLSTQPEDEGQVQRAHFPDWETEARPESLSQGGAKWRLKSIFGLQARDFRGALHFFPKCSSSSAMKAPLPLHAPPPPST